MAKIDYKACKKIINDLHNNTYDAEHIENILKTNICTIEEFSAGITNQAFLIKHITNQKHADQIKTDITKNRLNEYEL